jgi:hypothetical protein
MIMGLGNGAGEPEDNHGRNMLGLFPERVAELFPETSKK